MLMHAHVDMLKLTMSANENK